MSVSYSTIKAASEPEAIAELLATRVIGPVMPSVVVKKVRPKSGRRYEAPRVLWNVYEAELEFAGGIPRLHPRRDRPVGGCDTQLEYCAGLSPVGQAKHSSYHPALVFLFVRDLFPKSEHIVPSYTLRSPRVFSINGLAATGAG